MPTKHETNPRHSKSHKSGSQEQFKEEIQKEKQLEDQNFSIHNLLMIFSTLEEIEIKLLELKGQTRKGKKIFGNYDVHNFSHKSLDQLVHQAKFNLYAYSSCKSAFELTYNGYTLPESFNDKKAKNYLKYFTEKFNDLNCDSALQLVKDTETILFGNSFAYRDKIQQETAKNISKYGTGVKEEGFFDKFGTFIKNVFVGQDAAQKVAENFKKQNIHDPRKINVYLNEGDNQNNVFGYNGTNDHSSHKGFDGQPQENEYVSQNHKNQGYGFNPTNNSSQYSLTNSSNNSHNGNVCVHSNTTNSFGPTTGTLGSMTDEKEERSHRSSSSDQNRNTSTNDFSKGRNSSIYKR